MEAVVVVVVVGGGGESDDCTTCMYTGYIIASTCHERVFTFLHHFYFFYIMYRVHMNVYVCSNVVYHPGSSTVL